MSRPQFYIVLLIFTIGWAFVDIACPFLVPKGDNQATIRIMFVETAVFCYLFWLFTYLCQVWWS